MPGSDLAKLGALLAYSGRGYLSVRLKDEPARWLLAERAVTVLPALEGLLWEAQPDVNAIPYLEIGSHLHHVRGNLLWARTDTGKAAEKLRRFKPRPHVVLREGTSSRYVAFWALDRVLDYDDQERFNKRIAHWLGTPKKWSSPGFRFALPGSIVREGRKRPVPVQLARYVPGILEPLQVVGRLRDAPAPWTPETAGEFRARAES